MSKEELISIIEKELKENSKVLSIEIAKKHKLPINIVELFRRMIINGKKG